VPDRSLAPRVVAPASSEEGRDPWRTGARAGVHVGLLGTAAAALATLQLLHVAVAFHTVVGLVFAGLVGVHLFQRRRTIARLAAQLVGTGRRVGRRARLGASDLVLFVITVNMVVSGVVDWSRGSPTPLPLPSPFDRWHLDAGLALVVYLVVHVGHRRKQLWRSTIR
jgi:hypothetical protein